SREARTARRLAVVPRTKTHATQAPTTVRIGTAPRGYPITPYAGPITRLETPSAAMCPNIWTTGGFQMFEIIALESGEGGRGRGFSRLAGAYRANIAPLTISGTSATMRAEVRVRRRDGRRRSATRGNTRAHAAPVPKLWLAASMHSDAPAAVPGRS